MTSISELPFDEIWPFDFEFISRPGERPDVVCLCARELRSGRTIGLWRDQLGKLPPYQTNHRTLFVSFVANAECACHLALGWPLPARIFDLNPIFRNLTNGLSAPEGKGLLGALRYYGLDAIGTKQQGCDARSHHARLAVHAGRTTVDPGVLYQRRRRLVPFVAAHIGGDRAVINLGVALYHGEFAAVSAVMEHHGPPIDMEIFQQLADEDVWRAVRDEMVPAVDAQYGVYVRRNNSSDWVFSHELWIAYLEREGIYDAWPRLASGALDMRRKTFEDMTKGFPQLEALRQLRHARDKMRRIKLAVGHDARNRTVLWPFKSKTGRTQPKASTWIFSPAVWLRSLIKPEPGMAVAYVDYSSMEFLIAASLSDGHCGPVNNMLEMYRTGDPYLSFAKSVGAVPQTATKKSHETVRDRYKIMLLSVQYGLSATSLAARLNIPTFDAHEMLNQHHQQFAQYWAWSDDYVAHALQTGVVRTAFGWTYRIGIVGAVNDRSIRNWPIQSAGADILRIACILAVRHGIKLLAPVHDAVLIEAPIDRIEADVALMQEIMRRASRIVLNATADGTHELRTDAKIVRFPDRYTDPRGAEIWDRVTELLDRHRQEAVLNERKA